MPEIFLPYAFWILGFMVFVWLIALILKDNSIVDIFWGLGFCMLCVVAYTQAEHAGIKQYFLLTLVLLWGLRLSVYLFLRNKGKGEDFRYANWRKDWGKHTWWRAFFQVFLLQGFFMYIISLPILITMIYGDGALGLLNIIGGLIFIGGFLIESVADFQMYRFKANQKNKGKILTKGLWSISRHPNYFGEILIWWGIFMLSLNSGYWYIGFISPVIITWLLLKVSGVPMLEKKYDDSPSYKDYKEKTPAIFPNLKSPGISSKK